jgi:hypothetical protein
LLDGLDQGDGVDRRVPHGRAERGQPRPAAGAVGAEDGIVEPGVQRLGEAVRCRAVAQIDRKTPVADEVEVRPHGDE